VSIVVLLILAVVWAVFLIPQVVRMRAEQSPADSIGAFHRQLSVLSRTTPAAHRASVASVVSAPRPAPTQYVARPVRDTRSQIRKRRRDILVGLLLAMGSTLLLGLTPWLRPLIMVHVGLDVLFAAYVALLVRTRSMAEERRVKVRFLPAAGGPEPALLLRRSAN
jgi:hypothetical protein